ncbi:hypothetical protein CYMTET_54657 [Cymbomonas tetramitiformis]|uniref:EF-hand domain-containing protein n=1 Tax=Cymbomonas tetramitiformis TaxID=36881 RepID=A0AAE0BEG9_9CHLO|nr:hypothetical protein CYMTET_54657 [Cymbomonas tetramitiformis]
MPLAIIGNNFTSEWDARASFMLKSALREALDSAELNEDQIIRVFKDMAGAGDGEGDGMVDFDEFKTVIRAYGLTEISVADLRAVFDLLDVQGEESIKWLDMAISFYPEFKQLQDMRSAEEHDAEASYLRGSVRKSRKGRIGRQKSSNRIKGSKKRGSKCIKRHKSSMGVEDGGLTVEDMERLLGAWSSQNRAMTRLEARVESLDHSAEQMMECMTEEANELKDTLAALCEMSERLQSKFINTLKQQISGLDDENITITSMITKGYGSLMKGLTGTYQTSQRFNSERFQS